MAVDPDPVNRSGDFEVVRRGYARDQVDALVRELERRAQVAENARRMAEQHAAGIAEELRVLRAGTSAEGLPAAPQSFGFRAEKVVRLAEREASDIRAAAERQAEAARREAAEIRSAATREAASLLERAHSDAAAARADADAERAAAAAGRAESAALRVQVERGAAELRALRGSVREELSRLHGLLGAQLAGLAEPHAPAPVAETTPQATPQDSAEDSAEVEPTDTPPAWTPTPGTADLFDTPPRPAPRVPAPRTDSGENRHSLRSG
ncbi:hypothetical protein [Pseudonocardia xishanensis]|uniref:hypothetical protein n=1 Tax=Pseudonocardia xishanensis TaxID=630995 RepID=UPI0031EFC882